MPDGNQYHEDFQAWAQNQAQKLRAASKGNTEELKDIDFEHVCEEMEDLGRNEILRVKSLVRQAFAHLIKIAASPSADAVSHWERELLTFTLDASDGYGASYRQRIDMDEVWAKAQKQAALDLEHFGEAMPSLPKACPFDLDWMMGEDFTVAEAKSVMAGAIEIMHSGNEGLSP